RAADEEDAAHGGIVWRGRRGPSEPARPPTGQAAAGARSAVGGRPPPTPATAVAAGAPAGGASPAGAVRPAGALVPSSGWARSWRSAQASRSEEHTSEL